MTDERIIEDDFINIKGIKFKSPFDMMKWITKAVVEIEKLKEEIEKLKSQNENKREEIKMLRNEHKQDMAIHNNYVNKVEELKAQVEKYKTEKNYYDNLCHNKTVECDDLRKGIKQFQSDNDKFIKKD